MQLGKTKMLMNGKIVFVTIPLSYNKKLELKKTSHFDKWVLKDKQDQIIEIYSATHTTPRRIECMSLETCSNFNEVLNALIKHYDQKNS